ncbi:MAG: ABC transporter ATP-binding protein [Actinomycetaceae bacterium]|nr:ABC transporter ATP-binding protein [Actinomycetaceae bacterium]
MSDKTFPTIEFADVECRRGSQTLLRGVDISLTGGTVTGLIGPNGAGKSTFIATMVGDITPGAGTVKFEGTHVHKLQQRSDVFGVVTDAHGLPGRMTVGEVIQYWTAVHDVPRLRVNHLARSMGVEHFLRKQVKKLSTGMRRRLEIVLALLPDPDVLVLDEPFNGLDVDGVEAVRNLVRQQRDEGKIILLTTHTLTEIDQLADVLYAVHDRKLVQLDFNQGVTGSSEAAYNRLRSEVRV